MKNFKVIYYIAAVFLSGVVTLVYLTRGQGEKTLPKIKLSYFKSNHEVAESIHLRLQQEISKEKYFWFGIEPGHKNQLEIIAELKNAMEKENGPFDLVYMDQELKLSEFKFPQISIKDNWGQLAKDVHATAGKRVLIITAAIYSTNLIKENPIHKVNEASGLRPMTFSMGYFAAKPEEEKNNVFPCMTDDKEGVAAWGCVVVNKARSQRRRINPEKLDLTVGLMDLTGEKDYMVLVR